MREQAIRTSNSFSVSIGDLVAAAFDNVAQFITDPKEASIEAVRLVNYMLRHALPPSPYCRPKVFLRPAFTKRM